MCRISQSTLSVFSRAFRSAVAALLPVSGIHFALLAMLSVVAFAATGCQPAPAPDVSEPDTPAAGPAAQKVLASDGAAEDAFGYSVSISGDTALIGAFYDGDRGIWSGAVYVFTRSGTAWTQQAKLTAADGAAGDQFGHSVSISGDTALIGAVWDGDRGTWSGAVYVFTRSGTAWTQRAKLTAAEGATGDFFGWSVSLSGDTALIGARGDGDRGTWSGAVYVFTRSGTAWTQQAKLTAADGAANDQFGYSVSISGDTALIGVREDGDRGRNSGSAYVFTRSGTAWTQQTKLTAADGAAGDFFGYSVSLSGDTALIGARGEGDDGVESGSAYVFKRSGTAWTEQAKLTPADGERGDFFGWSVSLSGDTALIGAWGDDDRGYYSGSAYFHNIPAP